MLESNFRKRHLWQLGRHRLLCGDARSADDLSRLLAGERAHMAFLDPPYNVAVGSVMGRGAVKHGEFAMASGEMSRDAFIAFLHRTLGAAAKASVDGAVHFACLDWRHFEELVVASRSVYGAMLNVIAWVKTNAGQGWRSTWLSTMCWSIPCADDHRPGRAFA
jgi:DNA modification methylase